MNESFSVYFDGKLLPGAKLEDAVDSLARRFKRPRDNIAELFTKKPALIKENVSLEMAKQYQRIFRNAGTECRIKVSTQPVVFEQTEKRPEPVTRTAGKERHPKQIPKAEPVRRANISPKRRPGDAPKEEQSRAATRVGNILSADTLPELFQGEIKRVPTTLG